MSEMPGYDAAAAARAQKATDEAQFTAQLAASNPHTAELDVPAALLEDGGL